MSEVQPEIIWIDEELRLRKFDGNYEFALEWYQDEELVYSVDNRKEPYDFEKLSRMYHYLNEMGELYFIEIKKGEEFEPIGDVTFSAQDMPIVIGEKKFRNYGVGAKIVKKLIERGESLGFRKLFVREIFSHNLASQRLFEKCGFVRYEKTKDGYRYVLEIEKKRRNECAEKAKIG